MSMRVEDSLVVHHHGCLCGGFYLLVVRDNDGT